MTTTVAASLDFLCFDSIFVRSAVVVVVVVVVVFMSTYLIVACLFLAEKDLVCIFLRFTRARAVTHLPCRPLCCG